MTTTREIEIRERIAQHLGTPVGQVDWTTDLDSAGLGSLQFVEVFVDLQETFNVPLFHDDMDHIACLDGLVKILDGRIQHGPTFGRIKKKPPTTIVTSAGV